MGRGCPGCANKQVSVTNSLESLFPEVAEEWHPSKNGEVRPSQVIAGSHAKYWWKCDVGEDHEWEAPAKARTFSGTGCPFCRGLKVSVTNSLSVLFPDLATQWHPTKNLPIKPLEVVAGSNKKFWWKCDVADDHEWLTQVVERSSGKGCPFCRGLKVSTSNRLDTQFPEIAAEWHPVKNAPVTPSDVVAGSGKKYWWKCPEGLDHEWLTSVAHRTVSRTGCPFCAGNAVSSQSSLATLFPEIAAQWHPKRNGLTTPQEVSIGTNKQFWWKCDVADDHEWRSGIHVRTSTGQGCSFCAGRRLSTSNSLEALYPEVTKQWHQTKNGDVLPSQVRAISGKKYWWKCDVADDHEWEATPRTRTTIGAGCPCCSGRQLSVTNSLATLFPDVAAQWHPTKNSESPESVVGGSRVKTWWKCYEGPDHEWEATIASRTHNGNGCPCCAGKKLSVTNSLATRFPLAAAQWHPVKNAPVTPSDVVAGSGKKYWWVCDVVSEHEWPATVVNRTSHLRGCPHCTVVPRSAQEIRLSHELQALINFDLEAHRLRFAGRLRDVDILMEDLKLVVEFDGAYWHRNKVDKDRQKTGWLEEEGWTVIRVRERPLESIHTNDVMVEPLTPVKEVANLVLKQIEKVTKTKVPQLDKYLASDEPWREEEALAAIRAYQAERAAAKAERAAKKAARSK
jgi:very-short-patch-repair endonuclease